MRGGGGGVDGEEGRRKVNVRQKFEQHYLVGKIRKISGCGKNTCSRVQQS